MRRGDGLETGGGGIRASSRLTAAAVVKTAGKMSPAGLALAPEATPPGPGLDLLHRLLA